MNTAEWDEWIPHSNYNSKAKVSSLNKFYAALQCSYSVTRILYIIVNFFHLTFELKVKYIWKSVVAKIDKKVLI